MENYQFMASESSALVDFVFKEKTIRSVRRNRIMIDVRCSTKSYTRMFDHQEQNLTRFKPTPRYVAKPIKLYTTMDPVTMRETIARELGTLEVLPEQLREDVIDRLYTSTREMVTCNRNTFATCKIESRVDRFIEYVNSDVIMQRSFEENVNKMVPASDSSIKALKRIVLVDGSCAETCSVCLEDFQDGCQVLCLPCSHDFHPDCITKWLRSSHYCPNCRYEMPREE